MGRITPARVTFGVLLTFVGLAVAFVVKSALTPRVPPVEYVRAPVSVADIPKDTILTPDHIVQAQVPRTRTPGHFMQRDALFGRRTKTDIKAKSLFNVNDLYPPGEGPLLSAKLPPGHVAVTIETSSAAAALQGMVRPGERVDVIMTVSGNRALGSDTTFTLLENVMLLAVARNQDPRIETRETSTVTVAVTPEEANKLVLARGKGDLHLALRGQKDGGRSPTRITLDELLGIQAPEPPADPPPPPVFVAEAYRGTSKDVVEFDLERERALKNQRPGQAAVPTYNRSSRTPSTTAPSPPAGSRPSAQPARPATPPRSTTPRAPSTTPSTTRARTTG